MIRYTTPTISLSVDGADLTGKEVYVSLEQGNTELLKKGSDLTIDVEITDEHPVTHITFALTQEETAVFKCGSSIAVQVNWISADGVRAATGIKTINVKQNLLDSVIDYDD